MALAPSAGSTSASARPMSQGTGGSNVILQSERTSTPMPPSGRVTGTTSTAPGLTLGSQSLQSPWFGVQPSMSMSTSGFVTTHELGPLPVVLPFEPETAKVNPPLPVALDPLAATAPPFAVELEAPEPLSPNILGLVA